MTKNKQQKQFLKTLLAAITSVSLLIGCASNEESSTVNSPTPTPATANSPTPTPETILVANLPEQPWTVPGWLAVGTKPQQEGIANYPFSPTNPEAEIAIFSEEWSEVASGTNFTVLTPEGVKQEVQFRGSGEEPYGCDSIPTPMATFTASQELPEGGFWLLPPSAADRSEALALEDVPLDRLPTNLLPPEKRISTEAQAWQAGDIVILLRKETDKEAKFTIFNNSEEIFSTQVKVLEMNGSYEEPLDLSLPYQPGIPQPIGVFTFNSGSQIAIALWRSSFEGHSFQIVTSNQGKMELFEAGYVYYCAF